MIVSKFWEPPRDMQSNWPRGGIPLERAPREAVDGPAWSDYLADVFQARGTNPSQEGGASNQRRDKWINPQVADMANSGHGFGIIAVGPATRGPSTKRPSFGPSERRSFNHGRGAASRQDKRTRPKDPALRLAWEGGYLTATVRDQCPRIRGAFLSALYPRDRTTPANRHDVLRVWNDLDATATERRAVREALEWLDGIRPAARTGRPPKRGRPTKAAAAKRRQRARQR